MDMGQNNRGYLAGFETKLADFGGDASGAVDEDELVSRSQKRGGIIPLRRNHRSTRSQKMNFSHSVQSKTIFNEKRSQKSISGDVPQGDTLCPHDH